MLSVAFACGSDDPISPIVAASGSYTLQSVNGVLPFRIYYNDPSGVATFDIVSGTLLLNESGAFHEVLNYHVIPPAPEAPSDTAVVTDGFFQLDGKTITFTVTNQFGPYSWGGTVSRNRVTYTDPQFTDVGGGLTAVYVK